MLIDTDSSSALVTNMVMGSSPLASKNRTCWFCRISAVPVAIMRGAENGVTIRMTLLGATSMVLATVDQFGDGVLSMVMQLAKCPTTKMSVE